MISLKRLLREMNNDDLGRIFKKIQNKEFKFVGQGDNSRVYEVNGEDKVFKITKDDQELEVARAIENKINEFTTFIPVYWVGEIPGQDTDAIIMAKASDLSVNTQTDINEFIDKFKSYSYDNGGEVSIFDFIDANHDLQLDTVLKNFFDALKTDVNKTHIPELDLDLDFKTDNVMTWNGKLVLVDW